MIPQKRTIQVFDRTSFLLMTLKTGPAPQGQEEQQ